MRTSLRILVAVLVAAPLLLVPVGTATAAASPPRHATVEVSGAVGVPHTYALAELADLPQVTLTDHRGHGWGDHQLSGVLLQTLIDRAAPELPSAKNAALRVTATVTGRHHRGVAVAWGELDPGFGNHPGLVVLARDSHPLRGAPELVFPDDRDAARSVPAVRQIDVAVAATGAVDVPVGALAVASDLRTVSIPISRLAALPQVTRTVTYLAGSGPQTRVETGPTPGAVLRAARVRVEPTTTVAATGSDGYVAAVTPGEARSGGRPLIISLVEDGVTLARPRLVPDGDVRGGRYVSDLTTLTVSGGCQR